MTEEKKPYVLVDLGNNGMSGFSTLSKEIAKNGWQLFDIGSTNGFIPDSLTFIGALTHHRKNHSIYQILKKRSIPCVRVGNLPSYYYITAKKTSVAIDNSQCGSLAASFFAERGFAQLAYIGQEPFEEGHQMYSSFLETGSKMGCKVHLFTFDALGRMGKNHIERNLWESGKVITDWLKSLPKPVGLLTISDQLASRYSLFCHNAGLKVPDDVSILGIGNHPNICEAATTPISSIELPWADMWVESVNLLKKITLEKSFVPVNKFVPVTRISERKSTELLVIDNDVARVGIDYIWKNYSKSIGVEDIVEATGVSRRTLLQCFQKSFATGVNEQIRNKRLSVAKRLLLNTDLTVSKIAKQCGYNTNSYFSNTFVKVFGITPLAYRQQAYEKV